MAHPNTGMPFGPICGGGMKHGGMPGAYGGTRLREARLTVPVRRLVRRAHRHRFSVCRGGNGLGRSLATIAAATMAVRGFAMKAMDDLNDVVGRMLLNNSG